MMLLGKSGTLSERLAPQTSRSPRGWTTGSEAGMSPVVVALPASSNLQSHEERREVIVWRPQEEEARHRASQSPRQASRHRPSRARVARSPVRTPSDLGGRSGFGCSSLSACNPSVQPAIFPCMKLSPENLILAGPGLYHADALDGERLTATPVEKEFGSSEVQKTGEPVSFDLSISSVVAYEGDLETILRRIR